MRSSSTKRADVAASRVLIDPLRTEWTVWAVSPGSLPPQLGRVLGRDGATLGSLLFVSHTNEWRALTPLPRNWLDMSDAKLEACRARARLVHAGTLIS